MTPEAGKQNPEEGSVVDRGVQGEVVPTDTETVSTLPPEEIEANVRGSLAELYIRSSYN